MSTTQERVLELLQKLSRTVRDLEAKQESKLVDAIEEALALRQEADGELRRALEEAGGLGLLDMTNADADAVRILGRALDAEREWAARLLADNAALLERTLAETTDARDAALEEAAAAMREDFGLVWCQYCNGTEYGLGCDGATPFCAECEESEMGPRQEEEREVRKEAERRILALKASPVDAKVRQGETKHARVLEMHAGARLRDALDEGWVLVDSLDAGSPMRRKLSALLDDLESAASGRTGELVLALESLLVPGDHLSHPEGECTGECREVRRVLGVESSTTPVVGVITPGLAACRPVEAQPIRDAALEEAAAAMREACALEAESARAKTPGMQVGLHIVAGRIRSLDVDAVLDRLQPSERIRALKDSSVDAPAPGLAACRPVEAQPIREVELAPERHALLAIRQRALYVDDASIKAFQAARRAGQPEEAALRLAARAVRDYLLGGLAAVEGGPDASVAVPGGLALLTGRPDAREGEPVLEVALARQPTSRQPVTHRVSHGEALPECEHDVKPIPGREDWGRCEDCGEEDFPLTDAAAYGEVRCTRCKDTGLVPVDGAGLYATRKDGTRHELSGAMLDAACDCPAGREAQPTQSPRAMFPPLPVQRPAPEVQPQAPVEEVPASE